MARVVLEDVDVMCVLSSAGPSGAPQAFAALESRLGTLRGRRFYGACLGGEYRACVAIKNDDDPGALGLGTWRIPGGADERRTILDWQDHVDRIGATFEEMLDASLHDATRPSVEFYRSARELILLQPVE